ncbi:hypothetical protein HAX54_006650, partial [Datura stramonium]|nr:hypothetical protein [Datura stramonium]
VNAIQGKRGTGHDHFFSGGKPMKKHGCRPPTKDKAVHEIIRESMTHRRDVDINL